ncbi:MAG: hypothetical protein KJZ60_12090, partial [Ignavibacteriaceae bacterium]|nr:hypothetical protein [Ignavibacteriaceae bacterium]
MKNLFHTLFFLLLFLIATFPQDRIHKRITPEKLTAKRNLELLKSNVDDLHGLHNKESLLFKSKSSNWQTASRNLQREFYEEEGFDTKDTRTIINKTLLGGGFLVVEIIWEEWNGSNWVKNYRYSYSYDGNDNLTNDSLQTWVGSAWVYSSNRSYTYDGNNNLIMEVAQGWDGSAWVNVLKQSYAYDGSNNEIEHVRQNWEGSVWVNDRRWSYTY